MARVEMIASKKCVSRERDAHQPSAFPEQYRNSLAASIV